MEEERDHPLHPDRRRSMRIPVDASGDGREHAPAVQGHAPGKNNGNKKGQRGNPPDGLDGDDVPVHARSFVLDLQATNRPPKQK